jgi:hypothetical protein
MYCKIFHFAYLLCKKFLFLRLQQLGIIQIQVNVVSLDSTCIKVHPDGMGALKKRSSIHRKNTGRLEHQTSYGCRI